jgi:hypothetical protein
LALALPLTTLQTNSASTRPSIIIVEKFAIISKDKSACSNAVVKQKVYKQNYNNHDIAKYLIMHYAHHHIPGHMM